MAIHESRTPACIQSECSFARSIIDCALEEGESCDDPDAEVRRLEKRCQNPGIMQHMVDDVYELTGTDCLWAAMYARLERQRVLGETTE